MLSREENEILTRVGPGTPMGELMRRYWMPAALSRELPEPDCAPVRVRLLGENLVAFRDTSGRLGLSFLGVTKKTGYGVSITAGSLMSQEAVSIC